MPAAPMPIDELFRLKSLLDLHILDSTPEAEFDDLVQAAALVCGVPISLISLVDAERQWFKANVGLLGATETHRDMAFCAYAIHEDSIFEINDATTDARFIDNALVTGEPKIRFYAGAPLRLSNGANIGTLCVIDRNPRQLSETQRATLSRLAKVAVKALESRRALKLKNEQVNQIVSLSDQISVRESRYRSLYESTPVMMHSIDENGCVINVSNRWLQVMGYERHEVIGKPKTHFLTKASAEYAINVVLPSFFKTGFCNNIAYQMVTKNGRVIDVLLSATLEVTSDDSKRSTLAVIQDITEQKTVFRTNQAWLNAIRSQYIMSATNQQGDIIEVNDAFCVISQYSRADLLGQNHRIINSGHHPDSFFGEMWRCIRNGKPWRGEICNRAKDGTLYWVDSVIVPFLDGNGQVERYVSIRSDITLRKLQQEELRKSKLLLDRAGSIAGVGGWEMDLPSGDLFWSNETCRIHGVEIGYKPSLAEAIEFYAPEAQPVIQLAVEAGMVTGNGWDLELPFIQKGGQKIWVRAVGTVEFENDKPVRLVGTFQNITERVTQAKLLSDAHDRMTLATDSGQIGVWEYDLVTGNLGWDAWMFRLYGCVETQSSSTYELWEKHLHPEDKEAVVQALEMAIKGIKEFDTEFRIIWRDGSIHYIRATAQVIRDKQGATIKMVGVNWDVTTIHDLTKELSNQHELLRVTLKSIGDAVITTDVDGHITWLNPIAERMTGWSNEEAFGRELTQVFHILNEETRLKTENPVVTCLAQGKIAGFANHTVLISRNGDEFGIEDSASPIRGENGEMLGAILVFHDVTERRRLSDEVNYRAKHDTLTGLLNRSEFETRLRRLLHKTHEEKSSHALMFIDLDQFKIVNDTCGHTVGDQLLQQISKLFGDTIRNRDTLARLGGDEFGVILEHCTAEQAQRVAQEVCDQMENFRFLHGMHRFRIGASIGLVTIDNRWQTTAALMQAADTSCYAAKEAGRNRVHVWYDTDQAMRARHGEMQWTTRIEQALDDNRFVLYGQRIESLQAETPRLHLEILLRMLDTDGEIILPNAFLPAAERYHLASRIDRWVLKNTIEWMKSISLDDGLEMICINVSGQSIGDRAFHRQAVEILAMAGEEICQSICLEITETAAITNLADASLFIEQVSQLGVKVALDDFGAGASSFGHLKNLKVHILKIDGQFIKDLLIDPLDDAAVRCFIDVAKLVNLKTIAEFVDKPEVLERLRVLGIDYAQGYLLHRPEPINELFNWQMPSNLCIC